MIIDNGFYWVSWGVSGWDMWTVAFFNCKQWGGQAWNCWRDESCLFEIDEKRIIRGVK